MKLLTICVAGILVLLAPQAQAGLIGTVTVSELSPSTSIIFNGGTAPGTSAIAIGGSVTCPTDASSPLCESNYFGSSTSATISVTSTSVGLSQVCCVTYPGTPFDGFSFTGLTFQDGGSIGSVVLSSNNIGGISQSDVAFSSNSIFIDLTGVVGGSTSGSYPYEFDSDPFSFTLTINEATVPEPSSLLMIGSSIVAVGVFALRRRLTA